MKYGKFVSYELSMRASARHPAVAEVLRGVMIGAGFPEGEIVETQDRMYITLAVYMANARQAAIVKKRIYQLKLKSVGIKLKRIKKADWISQSHSGSKPFKLTRRFDVVPRHLISTYQNKRREPLYIEYGLAFGTGQHATTRFMSGFIERQAGQFQSFLDIGTGTGILSILAHHYGAKDIVGVDISREAVKSARSNLKRNGCVGCRVKAGDFTAWKDRTTYDFVAANLITHDLIKLGHKIVGRVRPAGLLAVSGISLAHYDYFRDKFAKYPLRCLKIERGEGWTALLFRKTG